MEDFKFYANGDFFATGNNGIIFKNETNTDLTFKNGSIFQGDNLLEEKINSSELKIVLPTLVKL